jgi:hypothetical protein
LTLSEKAVVEHASLYRDLRDTGAPRQEIPVKLVRVTHVSGKTLDLVRLAKYQFKGDSPFPAVPPGMEGVIFCCADDAELRLKGDVGLEAELQHVEVAFDVLQMPSTPDETARVQARADDADPAAAEADIWGTPSDED